MKHRRLTRRQLKQFIIVLIIFCLLLITNIFITVMLYLSEPKTREIIKSRHLRDTEINKEIQWYFRNGFSEIVYSWYEKRIGSRENTVALINSALLHGIPLHKSIAQSWRESGHTETAIGYNKRKDGTVWSIDIGLKQGNEYTFPGEPVAKMLDPVYNLSRCDAYFRICFEKYHNWDRALIAYNRGRVLDETGFKYMLDILEYEKNLDEEFNLDFPMVDEGEI